jgi:hypothetical protein
MSAARNDKALPGLLAINPDLRWDRITVRRDRFHKYGSGRNKRGTRKRSRRFPDGAGAKKSLCLIYRGLPFSTDN